MPILILMLSFAGFVKTLQAQDSDSPTISVEDVRQIRKIIAERDFYKNSFEESEKQRLKWQQSAENWQKLYLAEKFRADTVQEKRINELLEANTALGKANIQLRAQTEADRTRLAEQQFIINKLKNSRKFYFAGGFALGFGAGAFAGYQTGVRFRF